MRKLLAVSGGVDSIVMLHIFRDDPEVLVAHFNHGTRPSAADDQDFVKKLSKSYGKPFFTDTAHLGANTPEADARAARYNFLRKLAREHHAVIYTAHHADDLIETIAINCLRGTGWRGLAPLNSPDTVRPFLMTQFLPPDAATILLQMFKHNMDIQNLAVFKTDILAYAAKHTLAFRQDPTNQEDEYLRNRLRQKLSVLPISTKRTLVRLYCDQCSIKSQIENVLLDVLPKDAIYQRAWFDPGQMPASVAQEFLRAALARAGYTATRPQLANFLNAIQTYDAGKSFNLPGGKLVRIERDYFIL